MNTQKLMADPKAGQIYASLDTHIHPAVLADDYLQAKLDGDKSLCLALECFIRDLARMHFHRPEVLDALSNMERHKKMRKPGKGAPKALQAIADDIERDYRDGTYRRLDDGRIRFSVQNTQMRVTCRNTPAAVALVVAKYRAGMPKSRSGRYGTDCAIV